MKNKSRFILMAFCFYAFAKAYSQQSPESLLTKQEAIAQMLENNYGVRIAENQKLIAENNKGILNSGYLPTVNGTAGANYEQTDTEVDFGGASNQDGSVRDNVNIQDAETRRYNAAINVNYTLFDGLGRLYNYKRLKELYNLSELQARQTIETNALQLMSVYLEVARIRENVQVLEQALDISLKREQRAQYQFDYGQVNKLEVLNARVDINTDSINLLNAQQQLRNAKRDLNFIMQRDIETSFAVDTTVTLLNELEIVSFIEKASENNVRLLQADRNVTVSEYDIKTARSLMLPRIGLTGSYGWNQTDNPASAFFPSTTNLSTSLQLGANLTWDIFDGGTSITNYRNAQIRFNNEELLKKQIGDEVKRDIANARGNYNNALRIYQMQEQNLITNQNNFTRTEERYKLGQVSSVEFRQAQVNLLNAQTTKNLAKYDAKLAELQLLQLTGQLLNVEL
ncbi:transporter [Nonlabens sp. MIC269]|uniref:TolC family protein n=1 Tax=Nonlabens sp. MIC269 TaxID=1476901 RepID=UPI000720C7C6|nr:TolC family protein [Nonlabens sp. MIC269]ALM21828.1 transporter [Nonlabens sp. MIC269]